MSFCRLGNYTFRIPPSSVVMPYDVDTITIPTVGGRVVQVYGVTVGDITVQGLFGQDRRRNDGFGESWKMAEEFQAAMAGIVQRQSKEPSTKQLAGIDQSPMHPPVRFMFNDDTPDRRSLGLPIHNWDFQVYVKNLQDTDSSGFTVEHSTGKFSYGYTLTLFLVQDNSQRLKQVAIDKFINRLADGVGWKRTEYNGAMTIEDLKKYVTANSPDGTIHGLVLKQMQDAANGGVGISSVNPGGEATADAANTRIPGAPGNTNSPPPPGGPIGSGSVGGTTG